MDPNLLAELGVVAAQIPVVSWVVQPTINQLKSAFDFDSRQTLATAYCLSMFLMFVLAVAFDPNILVWQLAPVSIAKTIVAGWIAATAAGMSADSQKKTDAVRAVPPTDIPEIVAEPAVKVRHPQAVRVS